MRASNRRFCSSGLTSSQSLISVMPPFDHELLDDGAELEEALVLLVGAEAHDVLDAGAVVPAPVEDDDFARGGEMLHVPLQVHLRLLAVRWGRQRHDPEDARADALGDRLDRAALAGAVAPLEHDDDAQALSP